MFLRALILSIQATEKNTPTYFLCGTSDANLSYIQTDNQLLINAGNIHAELVTSEGAHVYLKENVYHMYMWMRNFVNPNP